MSQSNDRFIEVMAECGYDVNNPKNQYELETINVARCMWREQQNEINEINRRIANFKRVFEEL